MVSLRLLFVILGLLLATPNDSSLSDDDTSDTTTRVDDQPIHPIGDGPFATDLPPPLPPAVTVAPWDLPDLRSAAKTIARHQYRRSLGLPAPLRQHRTQHRSSGNSTDEEAPRHLS